MIQQYDSYKPSGIKWIGDIPSHWKIVRLAHIFNAKAGGDAKPELYSDTKDAQHPFPVFTNSLLEKQVYAYTSSPTFQSGSITVTGRGEIGHAFLRDSDFDAIIRLLVLTPKIGLCCRYFTYFIDGVMEFFSDSAAVSQLSAQQINKELVIIPPLAEQEAIAAWLDEKCGEIDAAIAKVNREIELIDELKQSEISRVVTRGLDPDAPLRPSGIDWIGDIPGHWEKVTLKHLVSYNDDVLSENLDKNHLINYVEIGDVCQSDGITNYKEYTFKEAPSRARRITKKGDVIISTVRTYLKAIAKVKQDNLIVSTGFMVLRARSIDSNYLSFSLLNESFIQEIISKSTGVSYPAINSTDIANIRILVPPLSEQQEIADYLDKKCAEIDGLKAKLTKKRETLTELRQSIISEVVTGKRKVI